MSANALGSRLHVFCDFDGTITAGDTTDILLEKLADKAWQDIEAQWERGELSGRECMRLQIPLLQGGWEAVLAVLSGIKIDNSFGPFVQWCRQRQIPVTIVSDGLDRVINYILKRERISVERIVSNRLLESPDGSLSLEFPDHGSRIVCATGACKCQILDQATQADPAVTKIVIGDGRSDFCWSHNADILFAKDKLWQYTLEQEIAAVKFQNFVQIRMHLEELTSGARERAGSPAQFLDVRALAQG